MVQGADVLGEVGDSSLAPHFADEHVVMFSVLMALRCRDAL